MSDIIAGVSFLVFSHYLANIVYRGIKAISQRRLRAFCRETRYNVKFTRIFRLLKNIVYHVHLARFALYCLHIARSLQKSIAQGCSILLNQVSLWLPVLFLEGLCKKTIGPFAPTIVIIILPSCGMLLLLENYKISRKRWSRVGATQKMDFPF